MTSDSSSSPSSSGTELADPNLIPDPSVNLEGIVGDQLASMGLADPIEGSSGSHTEDGDRSPEEEDQHGSEIPPPNGDGDEDGGGEVVEGGAWLTAGHSVEMEVGEEPSSPTSSGYDGERGSSGGTTSTSRAEDDNLSGDEIREVKVDGEGDSHAAPWLPGKRHFDEDDASMSWRKRKKHFFILSHSGKPIYSRYGDEHKLAGFSATLQAIISFVENGGDRVNLVKAGKHQVVFLVKGPIYLVCISCTDETYESLRGQLDLLYGQMILILTKSINRCFEKNPKFDMTHLLGGTDVVFSSLIHSFSWNPAAFLHAYTCLPLSYATRQAAGAILQDVCSSGVLFALLMCRDKVISLVGAQKASLHPDDLLLLSNFVMSSESFRTSESFSPICLPRYNPLAFLHAYVHFFDDNTYVTLLTTRSDAFYHLKDCRILIEAVLLKSNVLSEVQRSIMEGGMHVEDLPIDRRVWQKPSSASHPGEDRNPQDAPERFREVSVGTGGPAGLWHFMYRSIYLDQYVSSEFSPPITSHRQQKSLYRAYQKLYASMNDKGMGPHKTQYRRDEHYALLCWVTPDFELYAAFYPLADKAMAIKICNKVCQWVKDVENEIFLQGASPFSW
ncbi:PREDICTED: protein SAND-like [Tarenaya hassleriana]|uniref:protein SAND-like n=1 Tax=Tarenaya hassleriana TaxID=28532 RepID=UPI00053C4271|nr:PREDICTED: protein SAND-like [Tarenaya hassleriana]XP_010557318.1 PREDICTED: protein SAND-like [Tarenaya hassleriana]XP_010557319.1 PREDICTED: protein SAND-like [Tarenaya hassleriana]XP_010557320.1 PREDICTED: protein SAND-like [Tarenaya hassleriana]